MSSKTQKVTIYHNPRCSKSRNSLQLLNEHGLEVEEVRYLENPPSKPELAELCQKMGVAPFEIVRTSESRFKELGLTKKTIKTDDEWFELLVSNPVLIERPIVQVGDRVVMGRPPENILSILD